MSLGCLNDGLCSRIQGSRQSHCSHESSGEKTNTTGGGDNRVRAKGGACSGTGASSFIYNSTEGFSDKFKKKLEGNEWSKCTARRRAFQTVNSK